MNEKYFKVIFFLQISSEIRLHRRAFDFDFPENTRKVEVEVDC